MEIKMITASVGRPISATLDTEELLGFDFNANETEIQYLHYMLSRKLPCLMINARQRYQQTDIHSQSIAIDVD